MSVDLLIKILASIDGCSFSAFITKAMVKTGVKEQKISTLCELLEFTCAIDRCAALTGDYRHIPSLCEHLKQLSATNGNRSFQLKLPADWSQSGVYRLLQNPSGALVVEHRFSKISYIVPRDDMLKYQDGTIIEFSNLVLCNNYHDVKAAITSPHTLKQIHIANIGAFQHSNILASGLSRARSVASASGSVRSASSVFPPAGTPSLSVAPGSADSAASEPAPTPATFDEAAWQPPIPGPSEEGGATQS